MSLAAESWSTMSMGDGGADGRTAGAAGRKAGPPVLPRRRSRTSEESQTDSDIRELQEAFNLFDKNQDGIITRDDLQACLEMLGHAEPNDRIVDKIIRNAGNRNGEISQEAFILWMRRTNKGEDGVLRHAFDVLDRDGDGYLCFEDMKEGMSLLGENLSEKMLEIMFTEADRDRDGKVTYDGFYGFALFADFVYVLRK